MAWAAPPVGEAPAPKARNNRMIFGVLGALVVLGGGAALANSMMSSDPAPSTATTPPASAKVESSAFSISVPPRLACSCIAQR